MKSLSTLRQKIDRLDENILKLLNERAKIAMQIGQIKHKANEKTVYYPAREAEVLRMLIQKNKGPLLEQDIAIIYQQIISVCRGLQYHH